MRESMEHEVVSIVATEDVMTGAVQLVIRGKAISLSPDEAKKIIHALKGLSESRERMTMRNRQQFNLYYGGVR